jgi:bifunctional non-homologous end joining protein LigD
MKHSKLWAPPALRRVRIKEKTKVGEYLIADDISGVVSLAQMDVLEIHTWNSVIDDVERPNRIVFDLDPGGEVEWPAAKPGAPGKSSSTT